MAAEPDLLVDTLRRRRDGALAAARRISEDLADPDRFTTGDDEIRLVNHMYAATALQEQLDMLERVDQENNR